MKGGIYHRTQVDLTFNSNHIEGSHLTEEQTRMIFETNTIGFSEGFLNVDEITETVNHFRCIDVMIDTAEEELSDRLIKEFHSILKSGTSDSRKPWFAVGDYKRLPNEVGGMETCPPSEVEGRMRQLIREYNKVLHFTLENILDFHYKFERIHPFQDGNGRIGRLIMFKECLRFDIVPFIITEQLKPYYYRGLINWPNMKGYLTDTCLTAQDRYKLVMDYFHIDYDRSNLKDMEFKSSKGLRR